MASWSDTTRHLPKDINSGNRYEIKDRVSREQLNAIVENSFFASRESLEAKQTAKTAEEKIDSFIETKGDTVVTIDGIPQPTWSADFAESERQKSKNLWANGDVSGTTYKEIKLINPIPANTTFTISLITNSSDVDMSTSAVIFYNNGVNMRSVLVQRDVRISSTLLLDKEVTDIFFYASNNYNNGSGDTFSYTDIMITTDGSTDYQQYNGAIVHEKQLNEQVGTREILYDYNQSINISTSSLTTLQEYFDLFEQNQNATYLCNVGTLQETNFKTLVGIPPFAAAANYIKCLIKKVSKGNVNNLYNCYQLTALNEYSNTVAIGFIYTNGYTTVVFSGWQVIGG